MLGLTSRDIQGLMLIGVFLLPVLVYWPTAVSIYSVWMRSDTFAHGIIVFPLALYVLFARRDRLSGQARRPSLVGFAALLVLSLGWYASALTNADVVQQLSLALMMSASVWMVYGARIAALLLFPLMYVLFAVPIGEFLINPLMNWTADFTVFALQVTGIPVFREGLLFKIPSGNFEVAKACSGIRYLIASVALGVLFANMTFTSRKRQLVFIGISIAIPILANWLRAYGIVMIAHLSGMKLAVGVDHIVYGWLFFGLVMFLMFSFGWWLKGGEKTEAAAEISSPVSVAGLTEWSKGRVGGALLLALLTMLLPRALLAVASSEVPVTQTTEVLLPAGQAGWEGPLAARGESWMPYFANAEASGIGEYRNGGDVLSLFVAIYDAKNRASEMVGWENKFYVSPWKAISVENREIAADGKSWTAREALITNGGTRKLLWYWYESGSIRSGSDAIGKLAETLAALPLRRETPSAVALAIDIGDNVERSRELLERFVLQTYAATRECVAETTRKDQGFSTSTPGPNRCQAVARP